MHVPFISNCADAALSLVPRSADKVVPAVRSSYGTVTSFQIDMQKQNVRNGVCCNNWQDLQDDGVHGQAATGFL